ncbi:MAG: cytochrome c biogenesis protein ResB, partial [Paludibacter sp.]
MFSIKKLKDIFFSMLTTVILLVLFGAAIGYATFAESSHGTPYAKEIVYGALWFELLLSLLIINMIGSIFRYNLINRKKWSVLLFHLAFICILIGSAVTRYFGSEGTMHLRQGETSNEISSDKTAVKIVAEYNGLKTEKATKVAFSATGSNVFSETLSVGGKTVTVENEMFVPNAEETIVADGQGEPAVSIFLMSGADQSSNITLFGDEKSVVGATSFAFVGNKDTADILFSVNKDNLYFKSTQPISKTGMVASGMIDRKNAISITLGDLCLAEQNIVYRVDKMVFMIQGFIPKAKKALTPVNMEGEKGGMAQNGSDALVFKISNGDGAKKINVMSSESQNGIPVTCELNGVKVSVSYGTYNQKLPFSISLRKFELERYTGSMSPSSYASEITVTDTEMKSERPFRIYMNNILNYRGYRFFQSSYDQDEMGTILSVNHDYWGTLITYIGYLLMLIGMTFTLFSKNSRFSALLKLTTQIQQKRKAGITGLLAALLFISGSMSAAVGMVSKEQHLNELNSLLIQDAAQGRIEPFCTFASDVLRKIYKHNSYKGLPAAEVIVSMLVNPPEWKNEPMIKVNNPQLELKLGAVNGYVSYNMLFDVKKSGEYKLQSVVEATYQKEESARNKYEKEVLNVDERINICTELYLHTMLALFPTAGVENGKWKAAEMSSTSMGASEHSKTCPYNGKE